MLAILSGDENQICSHIARWEFTYALENEPLSIKDNFQLLYGKYFPIHILKNEIQKIQFQIQIHTKYNSNRRLPISVEKILWTQNSMGQINA